jgi:hypothetical protein
MLVRIGVGTEEARLSGWFTDGGLNWHPLPINILEVKLSRARLISSSLLE